MAEVPVEVKKKRRRRRPPFPMYGNPSAAKWTGCSTGSAAGSASRRCAGCSMSSRHGAASSFSFSAPAIDMSEDEKAYKITAELPGIDAKDIDVSVSGDMLVLKGEKRQEKEEKDENYHFSERAYGSFQRASSCRRVSIATRSPPIFRRAC